MPSQAHDASNSTGYAQMATPARARTPADQPMV